MGNVIMSQLVVAILDFRPTTPHENYLVSNVYSAIKVAAQRKLAYYDTY